MIRPFSVPFLTHYRLTYIIGRVTRILYGHAQHEYITNIFIYIRMF